MALGEVLRAAGTVLSSKTNLTIIFIIVAVAISLGAVVYFYYSFSSIEINKIA
jgi:flagellar basal body-associated protein FliL